jgi:hypothetical protein
MDTDVSETVCTAGSEFSHQDSTCATFNFETSQLHCMREKGEESKLSSTFHSLHKLNINQSKFLIAKQIILLPKLPYFNIFRLLLIVSLVAPIRQNKQIHPCVSLLPKPNQNLQCQNGKSRAPRSLRKSTMRTQRLMLQLNTKLEADVEAGFECQLSKNVHNGK